MDNSLCQWGGGGGLNAFYWYQIFALDSAVAEVQEMFSSHGGLYSFTFLLYLVLIKLLFVSLPQCNPHILKIEITTSKLYQLYLSIHLSITLYILSNVVYPYYFELPYLSMNHHASLFFISLPMLFNYASKYPSTPTSLANPFKLFFLHEILQQLCHLIVYKFILSLFFMLDLYSPFYSSHHNTLFSSPFKK